MNALTPNTPATEEFITASKLKERGWTHMLIKKFASLPDDYAANYMHPGGAPVRLYRVDRINAIEGSEDFRQAKAQSIKRQAAAVTGKSTKRETALNWLASLDGPKLPPAPRDELTRLAVGWYNESNAWRGDCERWWTGDESADYLAPIEVDYILHQINAYETKLQRAIAKLPQPEDLALIRGKLLTAIARSFPWLARECARRKSGSVST